MSAPGRCWARAGRGSSVRQDKPAAPGDEHLWKGERPKPGQVWSLSDTATYPRVAEVRVVVGSVFPYLVRLHHTV